MPHAFTQSHITTQRRVGRNILRPSVCLVGMQEPVLQRHNLQTQRGGPVWRGRVLPQLPSKYYSTMSSLDGRSHTDANCVTIKRDTV